MATFSKKRKKKRKLYAADFSNAPGIRAKRYLERFKYTIFINHNSPGDIYFQSLVSAIKRVRKLKGEQYGYRY